MIQLITAISVGRRQFGKIKFLKYQIHSLNRLFYVQLKLIPNKANLFSVTSMDRTVYAKNAKKLLIGPKQGFYLCLQVEKEIIKSIKICRY